MTYLLTGVGVIAASIAACVLWTVIMGIKYRKY